MKKGLTLAVGVIVALIAGAVVAHAIYRKYLVRQVKDAYGDDVAIDGAPTSELRKMMQVYRDKQKKDFNI